MGVINLVKAELEYCKERVCLEEGSTYVGVELADEGGEVAVLEVEREEVAGQLHRLPHHERPPVLAPRDHLVRPALLHHLVRLGQERRRPSAADPHRTTTLLLLLLRRRPGHRRRLNHLTDSST